MLLKYRNAEPVKSIVELRSRKLCSVLFSSALVFIAIHSIVSNNYNGYYTKFGESRNHNVSQHRHPTVVHENPV